MAMFPIAYFREYSCEFSLEDVFVSWFIQDGFCLLDGDRIALLLSSLGLSGLFMGQVIGRAWGRG